MIKINSQNIKTQCFIKSIEMCPRHGAFALITSYRNFHFTTLFAWEEFDPNTTSHKLMQVKWASCQLCVKNTVR